jgi:hypothetical protein
MNCPSCDFPVQVEWNTCRRCGAHLPLQLREREAALPHTRVLPARDPIVRRVDFGRVRHEPPPAVHAPSDTLLPHQAPGHAALAPRARGVDTLIPRQTTRHARQGAVAAALVGGVLAVRRMARRKA